MQNKNFFPLLAIFLGLLTSAHTAEIYIHYDVGFGNKITVRGNVSPLNWEQGKSATWLEDNIWFFRTNPSAGGFEFKPLINDQKWSIGKNYIVPKGNSVIHIYPFFEPSKGKVKLVLGFISKKLNNTRNLRIYLPPSYLKNKAKRYPVLYMHDGQNLFDPSTAFGGVEWQVDESMDLLINQGKIREAIVVGMDNTAQRMSEYTPTIDAKYGGGNGENYLDFIRTELVPYIDKNYRTLKGPKNTMLMGSSLGGLISFYGGFKHHNSFGAVACLSSSFWWNKENLTLKVEQYTGPSILARIYIDAGAINDGAAQTQRIHKALAKLGFTQGKNLYHWLDPNGKHNEASWAKRLHLPLKFLLN